MADVAAEVKQHLEAALELVESELSKAAPLADLKNKLNEVKDALEPSEPAEAPNAPQPSDEQPAIGSEAQG